MLKIKENQESIKEKVANITQGILNKTGGGLVIKSCPALCDLMDCSLPGSSVHGISQAGLLEWVAISSTRESSQPRDWTPVSCIGQAGSLPLCHLGSPVNPYALYLQSDYFKHIFQMQLNSVLRFSCPESHWLSLKKKNYWSIVDL